MEHTGFENESGKFDQLKDLIENRMNLHIDQIGKIAIENPHNLTSNPEYQRHLEYYKVFKSQLDQADEIEIEEAA